MFLQMMPINRSMTRETLIQQKQAAEDAAKKAGAENVEDQLQALAKHVEELRVAQSAMARVVLDQRDAATQQTTQLQRSHGHQLQMLHQQLTAQMQQLATAITAAASAAAAPAGGPAGGGGGPGAMRRASSISTPMQQLSSLQAAAAAAAGQYH